MRTDNVIWAAVVWFVAFLVLWAITTSVWVGVVLSGIGLLLIITFQYTPQGKFRNWLIGSIITLGVIVLVSVLVKDKFIPLPEVKIPHGTKEAIDQRKADTASKVTETVRPLGPGAKQVAQYYANQERTRLLALIDEKRQALEADIAARGDVPINDTKRVELEARMLFASEQFREWDRGFREAAGLRPLALQIIWAVFAAIVIIGYGMYTSKKDAYWVNTWGLRILGFGLWLAGCYWIGEYYNPSVGFKSLLGPLQNLSPMAWLVGAVVILLAAIIIKWVRAPKGSAAPATTARTTTTVAPSRARIGGFYKLIAVVLILGVAFAVVSGDETRKKLEDFLWDNLYRIKSLAVVGTLVPKRHHLLMSGNRHRDVAFCYKMYGAPPRTLTLQKDVWSEPIETRGCAFTYDLQDQRAHVQVRPDGDQSRVVDDVPGPRNVYLGQVPSKIEFKLVNLPYVVVVLTFTGN